LSQTEQEERAVVYATMQFYAASEGQYKNKPEVVSEIWSSQEDVTYMPADGGYVIGASNVYKEWMSQPKRNTPVRVDPTNLEVTVGPELAVVNNYIELTDKDTKETKTDEIVRLRATTVFRKEQGNWKVISHHVDSAPIVAK
ncbi:MAG: nuclear transport factor 2 family protein, partial [Bacteroidota bacterium]